MEYELETSEKIRILKDICENRDIKKLEEIVQTIRERVISEGFVIKDGVLIPPPGYVKPEGRKIRPYKKKYS